MSTDLLILTTDNGNVHDKHKHQISEFEIKIHQLENSISILNRNIKSEKDESIKVNEELIDCYNKLDIISSDLVDCETKLRITDNELINLKRNIAVKEREIDRKSNEKGM
jgi:chromosome segregation ATPase